MSRWAVALPPSAASQLGLLRLSPQIEICAQADDSEVENVRAVGDPDNRSVIWLRGPALGQDLERQLRQLAGAERFSLLADGQLVPAGGAVPRGRLPEGPWQPLAKWLLPVLPPAGWRGQVPPRVEWRLARTDVWTEPSALLISLNPWKDYANVAPQARLDRWTFAVDTAGRVLVRGKPLPPLPGSQFVEFAGLFAPAGWMWSPPVDPDVVRQMLALPPEDGALFHTDGSWERLSQSDWARATRSAARLTAQGSGP